MRICVCQVDAGGARQVMLDLPPGATAGDAVRASGLIGTDLDTGAGAGAMLPIGVHGIAVRWEHPVCEGDRVEIYHPLPLDPRARRWARAEALRLRRR